MKSKRLFQSDLAPMRRALATWRKSRRPRQPIPEGLWKPIALLAQRHGVSAVSRALHLDYYALKRRANPSGHGPDFVEVRLSPPGEPLPHCTAELEDKQGGKLVLRWSCAPGPELLAVVQAFWKQGA